MHGSIMLQLVMKGVDNVVSKDLRELRWCSVGRTGRSRLRSGYKSVIDVLRVTALLITEVSGV